MRMICVLFGAVYIAIGLTIAFTSIYRRMDFWKKMSDEEKKKVRISPLMRNLGGMIALCGLLFLVAGLWDWFYLYAFRWAIIAWFVLGFIDAFKISKGTRYQKK